MSKRTIKTPGAAGAAASTDEATQAEAAPSAPPAASDLPNAIDIDPRKITGAVLTNQGWVCPDETGRRAPDSLKP